MSTISKHVTGSATLSLTNIMPPKATRPEIPTQPNGRSRPSPAQRYPSTAFLPGPKSGDTANNDLSSPLSDLPDPQRLPRPQAAPSLSGPSVRPSIVQPPKVDQRPSSIKRFSTFAQPEQKQNDFQPEAHWAEMQRTLAEVELLALNTGSSSHIFSASHSRALEELRKAQLALAQAWARSEADDVGGDDSEDSLGSAPNSATIRKVDSLTTSPTKAKEQVSTKATAQSPNSRRRASSTASNTSVIHDLEAETEHDIQMGRKRREANDRYFQQVNQGVLDVVAQLDNVASAMKLVEGASREVWDDASIISATAGNGAGRRSIDKDERFLYDDNESGLNRTLTRTTATTATTLDTKNDMAADTDSGSETDGTTKSPVLQRNTGSGKGK